MDQNNLPVNQHFSYNSQPEREGLETTSFDHNTSYAFPPDTLSYQSFITSTDLSLTDMSSPNTQQEDITSFEPAQHPFQPIHLEQNYQNYHQQQPQLQPQLQQPQLQQPLQQQQPQLKSPADFNNHYDQFSNPAQQFQPQQILPKQSFSPPSDFSSLPSKPSSEPQPTSQLASQATSHPFKQLAPKEETISSSTALSNGSSAPRGTLWQELWLDIVPMQAFIVLLFIFCTAVLCIVSEECLSCLHILPCVSLIAVACCYKWQC